MAGRPADIYSFTLTAYFRRILRTCREARKRSRVQKPTFLCHLFWLPMVAKNGPNLLLAFQNYSLTRVSYRYQAVLVLLRSIL